MRRACSRTFILAACALALWACTGAIGGQRGDGARGGQPGLAFGAANGTDPSAANPGAPGALGGAGSGAAVNDGTTPGALDTLRCETAAVGPSPMRRLTRTEYDNSVRDLLSDNTQPARSFAADTQVGLFDNTASTQTVPVLLADQYLGAAVQLAQDVGDVTALVGCDPQAAPDASCVRGFIERFGRRAFRRPLASAEVERLVSLYDQTRVASDAPTGVRSVIAAVLVSPNFLFRPEFGASASPLPDAKLAAPFELAARLSSLLWASLPDDTLLDAAESGQLTTREQVAAQAQRMLEDPKAHVGLADFYAQWFGMPLLQSATKDAAVYPSFDDGLRSAMGEETRRFVEHVLWEDDARLATLLTAPYSFVNSDLATLYGVAGPSDPTTFTQVQLDPAQRRGVLTQASVLTTFARTSESSPVKRGKWVRTRILCQDLPDPPPQIPDLPAPAAGVSTRERFAMHTNNPACSGCHTLIDGLGFGLEAYDGIGAFRTLDQGVQVVTTGEVTSTRDIDGAYSGGPELALRLASSEQVRDCAPTQWLRYALGRRETDDDSCSLVALRDAFAASDGDLRGLMVALTQTDAFFNYRQAE